MILNALNILTDIGDWWAQYEHFIETIQVLESLLAMDFLIKV
jgi:hypothetical protein